MDEKKSRTNGIERAFQILDCLVELDEPATAYMIAKRIKAPLSTVYQTIASLQSMGVIEQKGDSGKFFLGARLFHFGLAFVRNCNEEEVFRTATKRLAAATGYDALVCVRDEHHMIVVAKASGRSNFRLSVRMGTRVPLNWSGIAMLLVGHLPPEERARMWLAAQPSPSGEAPTDPIVLEHRCQGYWETGFCVQELESRYGGVCIAAPVITPQGECHAVFAVIAPDDTESGKRDAVLKAVMEGARQIEMDMGWFRLKGTYEQDSASG